MFYRSIALLLSAMFVVSPAIAQDSHVVDPEQLQELIDQHLKKEGQDRREIRQALRHEEVQKVAGRIGLNLDRAEAAVATLDGTELRELASHALMINNELAGGQGGGVGMQSSMWIWAAIAVFVIALVVILLISN
jgi:hypothetical protein